LKLLALFPPCDSILVHGPKMSTEQIKGNWKQFVGKVKEKWSKLTDNDCRSLKENAISWLAEFRSAMELLATKQSVR
jgi:hypothetical protein